MATLQDQQIKGLDDKEKEYCAVTTMRRMLEKYSLKNGISFEDALFKFASSYVYKMLFDYETGIWSEGPDYLMCIFEKALKEN